MKYFIQIFKKGKKKGKRLEFPNEEKATKEFERLLDQEYLNASCGQDANEFWIDK